MQNDAERTKAIEKVRELISGIEFAMLTTTAPDGSLHSRPMATQEVEFDGDLWFFTAISSHKVDEIANDHHVNVAYAQPDENRYVSVSGTAQVVREQAKMKELWTPAVEAWFPRGLDDPDLALLRVRVQTAEYWEGPSSISYAIGVAASIVTGEAPNMGENKKVAIK